MNLPPPTPYQARMLWFSLTALATALISALAILLLWCVGWVLQELSSVLLPVALALIIAYILDPVVEFLVRRKIPRLWAIVTVFALAVLVVAGAVGSVVPGVIQETSKLVNELPDNAKTLKQKTDDFLQHSELARKLSNLFIHTAATNAPIPIHTETVAAATAAVPANTNQPTATATDQVTAAGTAADDAALKRRLNEPLLESVLPKLTRVAMSMVSWVVNQLGKVTTWAEFLIGFVLVPVYLFYFLLDKHGISRSWTDYLPVRESRTKEEMVFVLKALNDCMIVFFRGQVLVALCVGTLLAIGYLIMGLNYAALLGLVAATLGVVPYLGTIITLLLALTVAGLQFGDWTHPMLVLVIAAIVKTLEDFVISPKIIGDRSGLHPLAIILAVMIGTKLLGGIIGALFAIPLTAVLRTLMFRYVWRHRLAKDEAAAPREMAEAGP